MSRKVVLLLFIWLLPACAPMPGLFPSTPPPPERVAAGDLFRQAEDSYRRQAYVQALQCYIAYLQRYPRGEYAGRARLREAELLGLQGDWQGSLKNYQALLAQNPEAALALKARYGIGRAYFKLGQYPQATQVLDSLTAMDLPRSLWFSTQALLAEIALKQGRVSQAFARLRLAAQDLPSGDQEWFDDLKTRMVEQATPPEMENLATLYRDSPLSAALLLRLACLAQEAGRSGEASAWVNTLKERFPTSPEAAAADRLLASRKNLVGCLLPLSGRLSTIGFKVQRGMELAAREAPVELVFRDTKNEPDLAAQLVRDLAQEQRLLAIVGPITSGEAQAAADTAQAAGVPLVALSQKDGLTQVGSFIFQAFLTPQQQVQALVRHALGNLGLKRYAILYPDSSYGRIFLQHFQEELARQGGDLVAQEIYLAGTQDFAPAVTALAGTYKPDPQGPPAFEALFIPDDAATVTAIGAQLASSPLAGVQLLGTNLVFSGTISPVQAKALEGILFPEAFFPGDPNPEVQKFIDAYQQQYGAPPDYLAAQGFVAVKVLARVFESGKSVSRTDLPQQLLALQGCPELPWFLRFNDQRQEESVLYLLTIKDGRVQMVETLPSTPGGR